MPLKLYKRGKIWHYRGQVAGRRLRGSTGTSDKDIASQIAAKAETREWKSSIHGPESVLTFAQAALHYRAAGRPTRFMEKIEDFWKDTLVKDINSGQVQHSARVLYPKAAPSTRNRQVIVPTQAIINHAADSELCPRIRVKKFKVEVKEKRPTTLAWVKAFMAASSPHLGALALFMFLTGARISEALAVEWDDIDFTTSTVLIRKSKISIERRAHLPTILVAALANISKVKNRPVFWYTDRSNIVRVWRRACKRAGIAVLSPHSCRHGFATAMLHAKVDPVTVAKRGGWLSVRHVFETYGHASEDHTVTDLIAGTPLTQDISPNVKKRQKSRGS